MEKNLPTLERAYRELMPMFFGALARLARQGFVVDPADAMDLIHDFFAENWSGMTVHFRPERGSFKGYVYGAFVHFVRPRIVRLHRWRDCLIEAGKLDTLPAESREADFTLRVDLERVREAIANLPGQGQEILRRYVGSDYSSERALAKEFGVSRYRLREILVDALGRVTVSLGRPTGIELRDWEVACALWRDQRTVEQASALLRLTLTEVRRANTRNIYFLAQMLRYCHPRKRSLERRRTMTTKAQFAPLKLLEAALCSPEKEQMLQEVRSRAKEILDALRTSELAPSQEGLERVPEEWVAAVYQALHEGSGVEGALEIDEVAAAEALFAVHACEDTAIGTAFREVLLADLPESLREPTQQFRSVPTFTPEKIKLLEKAPDVQAGSPESLKWLPYGVTPVTVFYATEAVSGLLNRLLRRHLLSEGPIVLRGESSVFVKDGGKEYQLDELMIGEIAAMAECPHMTAEALYPWLVQVAQYKPWIFAGFLAKAQGVAVELIRSATEKRDVYQRWGLGTHAEQMDFVTAVDTVTQAPLAESEVGDVEPEERATTGFGLAGGSQWHSRISH